MGNWFLLGRCPRQVHIAVDIVEDPCLEEASLKKLCLDLFKKKEERLVAFYQDGNANMRNFLGYEPHEEQDSETTTRAACWSIFCGSASIAIVELITVFAYQLLGPKLF